MKQYPEIMGSAKAPLGKPCIAFYKYDGSNLRWEWSPKRGWYKFGTRTRMFDKTDLVFGPAIPIFLDTMGDEIVRRSREIERGVKSVIVFTEFFGPNTFAGMHEQNDPMKLRLFDVNLYKRGIMRPRDFVRNFGDLPYAAEVVYEGNLNTQFIQDVRAGKYPVWEGVVAKGEDFSVKIKTEAYMKRLLEVYRADWRKYWE
jgi:hypothetical protein